MKINQTVKKLIDEMRFHFDKKETYSTDDIYRMEDAFKKAVKREVLNELDSFEEANTLMITELKSENEGAKTQLNELTEKVKTLETENAELNDDLAPMKEAKIKELAVSTLEGKVLKGAEVDAYNAIDWTQLEDESKKEEFVSKQLETLFENKSYLKPMVETPKGDQDGLFKEQKLEESPTQVGSYNNFGYGG